MAKFKFGDFVCSSEDITPDMFSEDNYDNETVLLPKKHVCRFIAYTKDEYRDKYAIVLFKKDRIVHIPLAYLKAK